MMAGIFNQMSQWGMPQGSIPPQISQVPAFTGNAPGMNVNINGGDVQHRTGWVILVLSLAVALQPLFAPGLDAELRRRGEMIALAIGGFLLLYLLAGNWHYANAGIVLAFAGYALQGADVLRRAFGLRATPALTRNPA